MINVSFIVMFEQLRMFAININVYRATETTCVCQLHRTPLTVARNKLLFVDEMYFANDVVKCDCLKTLSKTGNYVAGSNYS